MHEESNNLNGMNGEILGITFSYILNNLKDVNKFVYDNLSLTLLNSRFAIIVSKIKQNSKVNYKLDLLNKLTK